MEPKIDLSSITFAGEDDHMGGYEFATNSISLNASDTITLNSLNHSNTVIGGGFSDPYYNAVPNVSITGSNTAPYTVTGGPYTISTGINSPWATINSSPKIRLDGEGADIEVNGESLLGMIRKIEERLNILHPDEKLEAEWEELRELGNRYRALEAKLKEQGEMWAKLKAMPPPEID
jgi:hypothetical protein